MKNFTKIILLFGVVVLYVIVINIFASLISFSYNPQSTPQTKIDGGMVKINIGQAVGITVTRAPHWWGRSLENNGDSYLHIFELIILPKKIKQYNFIWFHLIFLITITLLTVLMFTKKSHKEVKEYEKCMEDSDNISNIHNSYDN